MSKPEYIVVGARWTPDGQGGYTKRYIYERTNPGPPASPKHRPQRWANLKDIPNP